MSSKRKPPRPRPTCAATDEDGPCHATAKVGSYCLKHDRRFRRRDTFIAKQPKVLEPSELVSFKLPVRLRTAVKAMAARRGVSESVILREAVAAHVAPRAPVG